MALQVYRYANYLTTHEREQFSTLCKLLINSDDDYILIANPIIEGRELDALLIKRDAIIVLEFKNYSGELTAGEFGDWYIKEEGKDPVIVKGGGSSKNPLDQVTRNKWSVVNKFKQLNSELINVYHVTGLVVFNQKIKEEKYNFPNKIKSWFHIADMTNVVEKIENITSPKICINDTLWNQLPRFLNVADYLLTDYVQAPLIQEEVEENSQENVSEAKKKSLSVSDSNEVRRAIIAAGFNICHERVEEKKDARCANRKLGLSNRAIEFLRSKNIAEEELWEHQANAIEEAKKGSNVCITTSTSSGKTEIFQIVAIENLEQSPNNRILAVYPMKALNRQQQERWERTKYEIGKIDGDTDPGLRLDILRNSRVVVMTPDVIHAYLLKNLNDLNVGETIKNFIKNISLVIVDELHLYKGTFGTNSAYLFRRLNNIRRLLRRDNIFAQYITASATLPNACEHSFNVTGVRNFVEIGVDQDTSPVSEKTYYFVEKDGQALSNGNDPIAELVNSFKIFGDSKSITFVEGRQRTGELVNQIVGEEDNNDTDYTDALIESIGDGGNITDVNTPKIFPYRAGYENKSVDIITRYLNDGNFKGVISTSALEIGIDIDGLNIVIIADMPHDKNSYQQRIGRVGRFGCDKSYVIVVRNDKSFASKLLFEEYNYDIDMVLPDYEPALYLENSTVQNLQALCHVGDHDYSEWAGRQNRVRTFDDGGCFPDFFVRLCNRVLTRQQGSDYDKIRDDAEGIAPHLAYPLRNFRKQYKIVAQRREQSNIPEEEIDRDMLVTEGYIGAIRNTMISGNRLRERVVSVNLDTKEIIVRVENNRYAKTYSKYRKIIYPNFRREFRNATMYYGETKIYSLMVEESQIIQGYYEKIGRAVPTYRKYNRDFHLPTSKTTGTVFFHPSFNAPGVHISNIAFVLYEVFLRRKAFDRNDINFHGDKLYVSYDQLHIGDKFVVLYDASILNITGQIMNDSLLKDLFRNLQDHMEIIVGTICPDINEVTMNAINELCKSIIENDADVKYKDVGRKLVYRMWTEVLYLEDENDTVKRIGLYAGSRNSNTCYLLVDGVPLSDVPLDKIECTENTEFEILEE